MSTSDTQPLAPGSHLGSQGLILFTGANQAANSERLICSRSSACPHDKLPDYESLSTCQNLSSFTTGKLMKRPAFGRLQMDGT